MEQIEPEPGLVFHVIAAAGDSVNIGDCFRKNIVEVFAHVKREIIDFCGTLEFTTLSIIRHNIFEKVKTILSLTNFELIERRKLPNIAEDIYILGFSLVSKSAHKNLQKILKEKKGNLDKKQSTDLTHNKDSSDLLVLSGTLQDTVKALTNQVNELSSRVLILEQELSQFKLANRKLADICTQMNKDRPTSPEVNDAVNQSKLSHSPRPSSKMTVTAEVHHDKDGVPQKCTKLTSLPVQDDTIKVG